MASPRLWNRGRSRHPGEVGKRWRRPALRSFASNTVLPCRSPTRVGNEEARGWEVNGPLDFAKVNEAARHHLPSLLKRWLPDGQRRGNEWVARNPTRRDRRAGSFSVNFRTGQWIDHATGDRGGDPISLAAYLGNLRQVDAARALAGMLGVGNGR